ncbi:MAG: hypothetical protein L3J54_02050 [Draconibacterium sp.]|nr:hypothetical protein [Draconibacterium sp.]
MNYQIETEEEYREALNRVLEICDIHKTENDLKELYVLMDSLAKYERDNCALN